MPKVSVIIPAYNAQRFIRQTLDSILAQTFRDFEVLVVDDGSKDDTAEVVKSYGEPVRCIQKANGGVSSARNLGISQATGEYIALLDADDLWEPTKLEKQVYALDQNQDVGLCFVGMQRVDENLQLLNKVDALYYDDYTEALLLYLCVVTGSCSSALFRREIASSAGGFDPKFSTCADWEYWLRLSLLTKFMPIPDHLVKYRIVSGSMCSDPHLVYRDLIGVLDKFFSNPDLPEKYKKIKEKSYSNNLMVMSGEFLHAKEFSKSIACLSKALSLHPQNIHRPLGLPWRAAKRLVSSR